MAAPIARRRWWMAGGLIVVAALVAPSLCAPGPDPLQADFANPPQEARLRCYWWWLNGHTDEATITRDLEEMKAEGYRDHELLAEPADWRSAASAGEEVHPHQHHQVSG